jgi:hypothetical protein
MWYQIVTDDDLAIYYYSEITDKEVKPGTQLDAIVCNSKKCIIFAVDPIADQT